MDNQVSKMKSNVILAVGITGLAAFTAGLPVHNHIIKNVLFVIGAGLLTLSSYWEKEYFFSCLEMIAVVTAVLALSHAGMILSSTVMILLSIATIIIMSRIRKFDFRLTLGIIGLVLLSAGIIAETNLIMVGAGIVLCLYSYLSAKAGFKVGWVFLALNVIFTAVAVCSINYC